MASVIVTAAGRPSGIAPAASATAEMNISLAPSPRARPITKVTVASAIIIDVGILLTRAGLRVSGMVGRSALPASQRISPVRSAPPMATVVLTVSVVVWAWSVLLILTKVRAGELVRTEPYLLVKRPLYTSVALLVLPWLGFLLGTWLGALIGTALYAASRLLAPAEAADVAGRFGPEWEACCRRVKVPWL